MAVMGVLFKKCFKITSLAFFGRQFEELCKFEENTYTSFFS